MPPEHHPIPKDGMSIPEPSKRGFGLPFPVDGLDYFCTARVNHPRSRVFRQPYYNPADGMVYAASGYVAVRIRKLAGAMPEEFAPAPPEFLDRVGALPWHYMEDHPESLRAKDWRMVDDSRGTIYRDGPLPLWFPGDARKGRFHPALNQDTIIRVCGAQLLSLALLQLVARLPRVEICTSSGTLKGPILFRSSAGEAIIPFQGLEGPAKFELFKPRTSSPVGGMLL